MRVAYVVPLKFLYAPKEIKNLDFTNKLTMLSTQSPI